MQLCGTVYFKDFFFKLHIRYLNKQILFFLFVWLVTHQSTAFFLMIRPVWKVQAEVSTWLILLVCIHCWVKVYSWKALQTTHSPSLCLSSACSSLLWLTFVSGCTPLPTEIVSEVCPPYRLFYNPLSPSRRSENKYQWIPRIGHITAHFLLGTSGNLPWKNGLHASPNACHALWCRVMS